MLRTGMISRYGGEVVGPPPFDPLTLGLWGYYKASSESYADGDPSEATDLTGNTRPLTNATSSKRPTYKTGILNGKAVWRFDGLDDYLTSAALTLNNPVQVLLVCKFNEAYSGAAPFDRITDSKSPVYTGSFFRNSSTQMGLYAGGAADPLLTTTPEAWHWYQYVWNGASSRLAIDGAAATTGNPGANSSHGGFTVGARGDGFQEFSGMDVAEVMVRDSVFAAGELSDLDGYMASEYAL